MISARPNPVKDPAEIKTFFKGFRGGIVERGPKVIESAVANQGTTLKYDQWKQILALEEKNNVSHSILYNSLRQGLEKQLLPKEKSQQQDLQLPMSMPTGPREEVPTFVNLRPRIWAFIVGADKLREKYVGPGLRPTDSREVHRTRQLEVPKHGDGEAAEADRGRPGQNPL